MTIADEDAFHNDTLFWSIHALGFDRGRGFTLDPSFKFRVLDDSLSNASSRQHNRIGEQLLRSSSEMVVVDEVRMSIECDPSWNRELGKKTLQSDPESRGKFIEKHAQNLYFPEIIKRGELRKHLCSFYIDSPWPSGIVGNSSLTASFASRANFKKFWTQFRVAIKSLQISHDFPASFIEKDQQVFSEAHRPEHVRAVAEEERKLRERIQARAAYKPSASVRQAREWLIEEPKKFVAPNIKEKKKSWPPRSTEASQKEDSGLVLNSSPSLEAQPPKDPVPVKPEKP